MADLYVCSHGQTKPCDICSKLYASNTEPDASPPERIYLTRREINGHLTWVECSGNEGEQMYTRADIAAHSEASVSELGAFWQAWFMAVAEHATMKVIHATTKLVLAEREIAVREAMAARSEGEAGDLIDRDAARIAIAACAVVIGPSGCTGYEERSAHNDGVHEALAAIETLPSASTPPQDEVERLQSDLDECRSQKQLITKGAGIERGAARITRQQLEGQIGRLTREVESLRKVQIGDKHYDSVNELLNGVIALQSKVESLRSAVEVVKRKRDEWRVKASKAPPEMESWKQRMFAANEILAELGNKEK